MASDWLITQTYGRIVLVSIGKERLTDAADIATFGASMEDLCNRHVKMSLVLDLGQVVAMSSAMLGKLVALHKRVTADKGRWTVCGVKPSIMPLFQVTKLDKLFTFAPEAQQVIMLYNRKPL